MSIFRSLALMAALLPLVSGCAFLNQQLAMSTEAPAPGGTDFEGAMTRGKAYFVEGQFGLALVAFQQALERQPGSARALDAIAATYDKLQRYDLADHYYQQALEREPNSSDLLNNVGYSHMLRGDYEGARQYLQRAAVLDPASKVINANLAMIQQQQPAPGPPFGQPGSPADLLSAASTLASAAPPVPIPPPPPQDTSPYFERVAAGVQRLVTLPPPAQPPPRPALAALPTQRKPSGSASMPASPALTAAPSPAAPGGLVVPAAFVQPAQGVIPIAPAAVAPAWPPGGLATALPGGKPPPAPPLLAYHPAQPISRPPAQRRPSVEVDLSAIDETPGFVLRPPPTVSSPASGRSSVTVDLGSLD